MKRIPIQRQKKHLEFLKSRLRFESGEDAKETKKEIEYYERGADQSAESK